MDDAAFSDDPLTLYLNEIDRIPQLGNSEEDRCIEHVRVADEEAEAAARRLFETHLRLVLSIAERYRDNGSHILDLVQRGNEGLLHAIHTLANSPAGSFSAIATQYIERAITAAPRDSSPTTV